MASVSVVDKHLSEIERWILARLSPERATSAELTYDRMESQSDRKLPVIYVPLDPMTYAHWHDEALCAAFVRAMRGARRVLDIGPGDGWPSLRIAGRVGEVVGIDPSPRRVSVQHENAVRLGIMNAHFQVMDALSLEFPDASFDGVVAASSIEQTGDAARALSEVFRVLKPRGTLAMLFEDYGRHGPDGGADEQAWAEPDGEGAVLFYQRRTTFPPRETKYALFLETDPPVRALELSSLIESLERLAPLVTRARYYELHHLTSSSLDRTLGDIGFARIRHFDTTIPEVRVLFDASKREGRLERAGPGVWDVCRCMGAAAADGARPAPGDFAIARKQR
jgi:SAM-dependent methyltransferase